MTLFHGLTSKTTLGGIIGFSGYLFSFEGFELSNLGKVPILLNHGVYDAMVPFAAAKKSYEKIIKGENMITFKEKPVEHSVNI